MLLFVRSLVTFEGDQIEELGALTVTFSVRFSSLGAVITVASLVVTPSFFGGHMLPAEL